MQNSQPRGTGAGSSAARRVIRSLAVAVTLLLAAATVPPPEPAEAACCVCRGGGCGAGFCADAIANLAACGNLCEIAGCPNGLFDPIDVCAGGCDVASPLPTATPTPTVNTPTHTPSLTPTVMGATSTAAPTATPTRSVAPTPGTCCQRVQACSIAAVPMVCGPGEERFQGALCVAGPPRPVGEPTVSMCAFATPTQTQTGTPTITLTPTGTLPPTPSFTQTPPNTPTLTSTATITATPQSTHTIPPLPTPAICCQNGTLCDDTKGQNFTDGRTPAMICLPGGGAANIPLTPVPYSSCMRNVGCIPFTPTGTFTATPVNTATFTLTPTVTPTLRVPDSIDPYKCYRIKDESAQRFRKPQVKIVDRFGGTRTAVLKPFLLCNPANESNLTQTPKKDGEQIHPEAHTVCFKIRDQDNPDYVPLPGELRVIFGDNPPEGAFTTIRPEFGKGDLLCMPAAFVAPTPTPRRPCTVPTQCPEPRDCFEGFCRNPTPSTPTPTIAF